MFSAKFECQILRTYPTLADLHVYALRSFVRFNKAPTKFNEDLTKPFHGLIEILLHIDFRCHSK